jgi:hypothetical protein
MLEHKPSDTRHTIAEAVRAACARAAVEGYQRAAMDGLCAEGALECAVGAIRSVDIDAIIEDIARWESKA